MSKWNVARDVLLGNRCRWQRNMAMNYIGEHRRGVVYFDDDLRAQSTATIRAGVVYIGDEMVSRRKNSELVTSSRLWFSHGRFVYVLVYGEDMQKEIYMYRHVPGTFHHSSAWCGRPVIDSGMMTIANGRIAYIEHKSGHYKPNFEQLRRTLAVLQMKGVDLSSVFVTRRMPFAGGSELFASLVEMGRLKLYSALSVLNAANFDSIPEIRGVTMDNIDGITRVVWDVPEVTRL